MGSRFSDRDPVWRNFKSPRLEKKGTLEDSVNVRQSDQ